MPGRFDTVLLASPVDLAAVRKRTGGQNLVLVPNGVDLDNRPSVEESPEPNRIIFFGKLDYLPNADAAIYFVREILPLVRRTVPEAQFLVAGWSPPRAVRALGRMEGVTVRANVPDIKVEVSRSVVSVAPLRFGAGTQYKILESLALGVPVVATPEPARALVGHTTGPILVGRNPQEFANQVARLLTDAACRERMGRAGRSLVQTRYSWERVLAPLDRVLEGIIACGLARS
jgi:glycosyltransferase involved in cell wall biosynthesis